MKTKVDLESRYEDLSRRAMDLLRAQTDLGAIMESERDEQTDAQIAVNEALSNYDEIDEQEKNDIGRILHLVPDDTPLYDEEEIIRAIQVRFSPITPEDVDWDDVLNDMLGHQVHCVTIDDETTLYWLK